MSNHFIIAELFQEDCSNFNKGKEVAQYILQTGYTGPLDFEGCYVSAQFFTTLFTYLKVAEGVDRINSLELLNIPEELIQCMEDIKYYILLNKDI